MKLDPGNYPIVVNAEVMERILSLRIGTERPEEVIARVLGVGAPMSIQPIQQPPAEDLRNAVWILGMLPFGGTNDTNRARDLITLALGKLGEPSALVVAKTKTLLDGIAQNYSDMDDAHVDAREARDIAAVVLVGQLEGR